MAWGRCGLAVSDEGIYKRLECGGTDPPADLFAHVTALLTEYIGPSRPTVIHAPDISIEQYQGFDPALPLARTPRYAERKSLHRPVMDN